MHNTYMEGVIKMLYMMLYKSLYRSANELVVHIYHIKDKGNTKQNFSIVDKSKIKIVVS